MPNAFVPVAAPGLPSSRRTFILGLAVAPIVGTALAVTPVDPHVALAEEAVVLWHRSRAVASGFDHPTGSPEEMAASEAHSLMMDKCLTVAALPPPATLPGLTSLAIAISLACEEMWLESHDQIEGALLHFLEAVRAFTGAVMPEGYAGLLYSLSDDEAEGGEQ